jgi:NAD(P)H-nitrite reductase large subunit
MAETRFNYCLVGGGQAGESAIAGIRLQDKNGSILLLGSEKHRPYDRPPLTKQLWFGKKKVEEIFLHDAAYYDQNGVTLLPERTAVALDTGSKTIRDQTGAALQYDKLLLATGGIPRRLAIPGGDLDGVCYYRYLDDYLATRQAAVKGGSAVVIGGGFIGSEIAAALNVNGVNVTMIFPGAYLVDRVFPESLGRAIQADYLKRGVRILAGDTAVSIARNGTKFVTRTQGGQMVESDLVIVGVGIAPAVDLAQQAGLATQDGIIVNEFLQSSAPDVYAAGDCARWTSPALGQSVRLEHWNNALSQGKWAGRNMAGAAEPFTYLPYFFSDLFDFGYEAVGLVEARLTTFADWQKENEKGVIYYSRDGRVVGAMMCNVWKKVPEARKLIVERVEARPEVLRGRIQ